MTSDQLERRCTATSKRSGNRCKRPAIEGGTVCTMHGGRAPQVQQAAKRRLVFAEACEEFSRLGQSAAIVDPSEAMLQMVYEAAANVAVLRRLIGLLQNAEIDDSPGMIEGEFESKRGEPPVPSIEDIDRSELGASIAHRTDPSNWKAAPHVWVVMYNDERERLVKWAKMCRDAGVEERRVAIAEEDGRRLVDVLLEVVDGLFGLLAGKVKADVLDGLRRDALPGLVQQAIETTGRAA